MVTILLMGDVYFSQHRIKSAFDHWKLAQEHPTYSIFVEQRFRYLNAPQTFAFLLDVVISLILAKIMLKKIIFACIWICLLSYTVLSADTLIKLKGNSLVYDEELEQLIASGNASLNHPDFSVFAKKLVVNTQLNTVDGIGDILIQRNGEQLISDYFHLNLDSKEMQFGKLSLTVDGKNGKLYIHASSFNETETEKHGLDGHLTTCDLRTPHYSIKTRSFLLNPGERFIGKHVIIEQALVTVPLFYGKSLTLYVSPTLFFPFWMPSYIYELGKRKVVYLFPKFGTNTTEGFWFKSQFDYYNSESNWDLFMSIICQHLVLG